MGLMDQLGGLLQQYAGAGAAQAPSTVHDDFINCRKLVKTLGGLALSIALAKIAQNRNIG